jgi:uncharacterized membrane-anchored protein YjiN (DUF445 family)
MTLTVAASGLAASSADARRARSLARMRLAATALLALMAVVFVLASLGAPRWPALAYVRAFAEAGVVGACADWFAVTALFRRPLGLPIPHTAIIPRNKDRIGEALGDFIAENFLTEAVLDDKLRALQVARWGGDWLQQPQNARRLARRIAVLLPEVLGAAPPGLIGGLAGSAVLAAARATPAGPAAARLLGGAWREGYGEALIDRGLALAADYVAGHPETIRHVVAAHAPGWLRWFDKWLAGKVADGLAEALAEMRAPDHRLRRELRVAVARWLRRLRGDPGLQREIEDWKERLLAQPAFKAELARLGQELEGRIGRELAAEPRGLAVRLERALRQLGAWLGQDSPARDRLNAWARELATRVIAPRRQEIGRFVAEVVAGWEARSVTEKLELHVGKDLQYIRINGALIGGLVGLAVYSLARATGLT